MDNLDETDARVEMRVAAIMDTPRRGSFNLVLKEADGERRLIMGVGLPEAQAIAVFLEHVSTPRPLTHDLMSQMIDAFGVEVVMVVVEQLRNGYFISSIVCRREASMLYFDARTSDAIAIALRSGAPIYARESVLSQVVEASLDGHNVVVRAKVARVTKEQTLQEMPAVDLQRLMQQAIANENYERAQEIQAEMRRRENL